MECCGDHAILKNTFLSRKLLEFMIFYKLERAEHFYAILAFQNALKSFRRVGLIKKGKNGLVTYPISWQKTTFGALLVGLITWV